MRQFPQRFDSLLKPVVPVRRRQTDVVAVFVGKRKERPRYDADALLKGAVIQLYGINTDRHLHPENKEPPEGWVMQVPTGK